MLRVSVTVLEKFRRWMAGCSSYDTEQALINTLSGAFLGNDKTWFGTAFHKLVERPDLINGVCPLSDVVVEERGIKVAIPYGIAEIAVNYRLSHPVMTCELPIGKTYNTGKETIWVGGRLDAIEGAHIRDAKTKFRHPDVIDYMDSSQWRLYSDMLGTKVFFYDVFEIVGFTGLTSINGILYPLGIEEVIVHEPIPCYSYPTMHEYCTRLVADFMEWVDARNLRHLLKPYERPQPLAPAVIIDLYSEEVLGGKQCPYCGRPSEYVDSSLVYGKSFGMMYRCEPCSAWVGVHTNDPTKSLGRLANSELRQWKIRAHAAFDPIWKQKGMSRTAAYQWLSAQLDMRLEHTHIGMFDVDLCKQTVDVCAGKKIPAQL